MIPIRTLDGIRWIETVQCVHNIDINIKCTECDVMARDAEQMFAPADDKSQDDDWGGTS